jgi:hypothetical protein
MRTLWANSLELDREQLSSAQLIYSADAQARIATFDKPYGRPHKMTSRAACGPRATSWLSLIYIILTGDTKTRRGNILQYNTTTMTKPE